MRWEEVSSMLFTELPVIVTDDGIVFLFPDGDLGFVHRECVHVLSPEKMVDDLVGAMGETAAEEAQAFLDARDGG
jgi:hypothetical protein